jgi:hypothetical protein
MDGREREQVFPCGYCLFIYPSVQQHNTLHSTRHSTRHSTWRKHGNGKKKTMYNSNERLVPFILNFYWSHEVSFPILLAPFPSPNLSFPIQHTHTHTNIRFLSISPSRSSFRQHPRRRSGTRASPRPGHRRSPRRSRGTACWGRGRARGTRGGTGRRRTRGGP